ncbi:MAG: Do family serine endopeptidase [Sphingobacteriaceae bacterium]
MKKIGLTFLTAIIGGAVAIGTYKAFEKKDQASTLEDRQKVYFANDKVSEVTSSTGDLDFTQAAAAVTPAVVYIRTTYSSSGGSSNGNDAMQDLFGDMFGGGGRARPQGPQRASGSGVIISPDGYIVTNNHVVEKADKIEVSTNDRRVFQAKVIGTDPSTDLALLKITANNLPIVKLGNSDNVRVGEWVLAVGNPFNLTSTVTAGIVSAKGRNIGILGRPNQDDGNPGQQSGPALNKAIESFIQTDAAINPGNSGGALVNTKGELIGINSAIASHTGSYEGYGFAIPVNLAKKVLNDLEKFGVVKRGFVGVTFTELNPDVAGQLGVKTSIGLYVNGLVKGGGAEIAGLNKGDIITKVDGNMVYASSDLQEHVGRLQPGDKIKVTVIREGKEKMFNVTLKGEEANLISEKSNKSAEEIFNKLGASFTPLTEEQKGKFGVSSGVVVTQVRPGRMFDATDIPVGSVIVSINKKPVNSVADMDKALTADKQGMLVISGIAPDGSRFTNTFQIR